MDQDNKMHYLCLTATAIKKTFRKLHHENRLVEVALQAVADTVGSFMNLTDYKTSIFETYAGHRISWWTTIPNHILEIWSSSRPNCTTEDILILDKVNDLTAGSKLFFAGEAFSRHYRGTLHGALMSGKLSATEMLTSRMDLLYDVQVTFDSAIRNINGTIFNANIGRFVFDADDHNCTELLAYMHLMVEQEQLNYVKLIDPPLLSGSRAKIRAHCSKSYSKFLRNIGRSLQLYGLDVGFGDIDDAEMVAIVARLKGRQLNIHALNISSNAVGDEGLNALVNGLILTPKRKRRDVLPEVFELFAFDNDFSRLQVTKVIETISQNFANSNNSIVFHFDELHELED